MIVEDYNEYEMLDDESLPIEAYRSVRHRDFASLKMKIRKRSRPPRREEDDIDSPYPSAKRRMREQARTIDKENKENTQMEQTTLAAMCGTANLQFDDSSRLENPHLALIDTPSTVVSAGVHEKTRKPKVEMAKTEATKPETSKEKDLSSYGTFLGLKFTPDSEETLKFFTDPRSVKPDDTVYYIKDEYTDGTFRLEQVIRNKAIIFVFRNIDAGYTTSYSSVSLRGVENFALASKKGI